LFLGLLGFTQELGSVAKFVPNMINLANMIRDNAPAFRASQPDWIQPIQPQASKNSISIRINPIRIMDIHRHNPPSIRVIREGWAIVELPNLGESRSRWSEWSPNGSSMCSMAVSVIRAQSA